MRRGSSTPPTTMRGSTFWNTAGERAAPPPAGQRMTPGIGLALVAMVCFGIGDLIYKRAASEGVAAHHFIMVQAWFFCPLITLYALLTGTLVLNAAAIWGTLAGLCALIGFYNFAHSLRFGAVSTNAPIFRLNFTI